MSPVWSAPSSLASSIVKAGLSRVAEVIDRAPVSGDTMSHMLYMIPMAVATTRMNTILLRVKIPAIVLCLYKAGWSSADTITFGGVQHARGMFITPARYRCRASSNGAPYAACGHSGC
jgi:hypothetical protein